MKIGVITFWYGNENYGMILQCWAMQQILKKLGHSPFVIRYIPTSKVNGYKQRIKRFLKPVINIIKTKRSERNKIKKRNFDDFRKIHLSFSSSTYYFLEELQTNPPNASCYIAGSDQVWAQLLSNPQNEAFFLNFGDPSIRRVAYAPSFAMDEYPVELHERLKKNLIRFDRISCREQEGVDICKELGFSAIKVIDPTLLLDMDTYLQFVEGEPRNADYIYLYYLNIENPEDIKWNELAEIAQSKQLKIVATSSNGYFKSNEIFGNVQYDYSTVQGWISNIYHSKLVVTPSFHGVVFSIVFKKDFVYIPLVGKYSKGNNRVLNLLKELKLEDRILSQSMSYEKIVSHVINWSEVSKKLEILRELSLDFLRQSLFTL